MPSLTAQDGLIRSRWSAFLSPLVGRGEDRVTVSCLSAEVDKIAAREGDNRAEIYAYLAKKQTARAGRVFEIGEALRTCGIVWCSGIVALWAAGYLGEAVRSVAKLAQNPAHRDHAVALGGLGALASDHIFDPLFPAHRSAIEAARVLIAEDAKLLADAPDHSPGSPLRATHLGDELLAAAAGIGDAAGIEFETRDRVVRTLAVEWGITAARDGMRDFLKANLALLQAALWFRLDPVAAAELARATESLPSRTNRRNEV